MSTFFSIFVLFLLRGRTDVLKQAFNPHDPRASCLVQGFLNTTYWISIYLFICLLLSIRLFKGFLNLYQILYMSDFGKRLAECRKAKNLSQKERAKLLETSHSVIGKYECNENLPSIEMVIKMAKAFNVSVDFLLGEGEYASYDKDTIRRIQDIEKLDSNTRTKIFDIIDTYLRDAKTRQAYGI